MSDVSRTDLISFVAGSLYGESPLSLEDAVTGALRLLDEFAEHNWHVVELLPEDHGPDEDRIEFGVDAVPTMLVVNGKRYDVVPAGEQRLVGGGSDLAVELAERFDERETSAGDAEPEVVDGEALRAALEPWRRAHSVDDCPFARAIDCPWHRENFDGDEEIETLNDFMSSIQGSGDDARFAWLASSGCSRETALRHAAWIVAMADPIEERFPKVLRAVMST